MITRQRSNWDSQTHGGAWKIISSQGRDSATLSILQSLPHPPPPSLPLSFPGNPQSLKQQPMTFVRQVVSLVTNPHLLENHSDIFPSDAVARAKVREGVRARGRSGGRFVSAASS